MLVTCIFSFSHSVFYSILREIIILARFDLSPANALNLVKSKIFSFCKGLMSNFSFSHSVFNSYRELSAIFVEIEIVVCKLFKFLKFVQHFLLFLQCYLSFPTQISIFQLPLFCCLQMLSIWAGLKFVIW